MEKKRLIVTIIIVCFLVCNATVLALDNNWTYKQEVAHQIADLARDIKLPEEDPIIIRAQEIWWEEKNIISKKEEILPIEEYKEEIDFYNGILPYEITYNEDTEYLAEMLAKTVFAESRGIYSIMEQAAIIQTVYNRTRSENFNYPTLYNALTAPNQFAYFPSSKTIDDYGRDLIALARDVMYRNTLIDQGYKEDEVGIILAPDYYYYAGDGSHNYFRNAYINGQYWDWRLPNPYDS